MTSYQVGFIMGFIVGICVAAIVLYFWISWYVHYKGDITIKHVEEEE